MHPRFSDDELHVVSYTERYDVSRFDSTAKKLNDFLKEDALKNQKDLISKTYLCYHSNQLIGYVTLTTDIIRKKDVRGDERIEVPYDEYPAIKIARLATDKKYEKMGVGTFLLLAAIGMAADISKKVGCRFITVDSKQHSIGFYKKHGFKLIKRREKRNHPTMYLDIMPAIEEMKPMTAELHDFM
jgi:GNAT superfamily N-acetyltransferase